MTTQSKKSPRIANLRWGRIELDDGRRYKDVKLFPGGAREWDWREAGTAHNPGISTADVEDLFHRGATTVVLSQGLLGRLGVADGALELLEASGVENHILKTEEAVELYNELRETRSVAGLFHSTC